MRLKKVILNNFGEYHGTEISLDTPVTMLGRREETAGKAVIDAIVGVLFGCPPNRRGEFSHYAPASAKGAFSASLLLATENGKEYLIGKDFRREQLEVFQQDGFCLTLLPPASIMEILHGELKTLNPIDFEALFVFGRGPVEISQDSPALREQLHKIADQEIDQEAVEALIDTSRAPAVEDPENTASRQMPEQTGDEVETAGTAGSGEPETVEAAILAMEGIQARRRETEEKIEKLRSQSARVQARVHEIKEDLLRVKGEREELASYEPFLAGGPQTTVEGLSHQLATIELERKYLEEKIREERDNTESVKREIRLLREKIATFPQEFMDPGLLEQVKSLVRQKEEKFHLLRQLEEKRKIFSGRKGILGRRGRREETAELEEKIARQMDEISGIRSRLNTLLKGRQPEEFLQEVKLQEKYLADLTKLEKNPVTMREKNDYEEQCQDLLRQEAEIRSKMQELLVQAGSEEYEEIKEKIKHLGSLINREKELQREIEALERDASAETLAALEAERTRLAEEEREQEKEIELRREKAAREREEKEKARERELEAEKERAQAACIEVDEEAAGEDPFTAAYCRLVKVVQVLSQGEFSGIYPEIRDGEFIILVREKATASWVPEQNLPLETRNLLRLAFRVFLARLHTPAKNFPLLFETPTVLGSKEERERVLTLLEEVFPEVQVLTFLPEIA